MSELPDGWVATTLGCVAELSSGFGFPKKFQGHASGAVPFAKVRDISFSVQNNGGVLEHADHWVDENALADMKAKPVPAGSVVFAKIGEAVRLNRRALLKQDTVIDNNCMALSPTPAIGDPRYLLKFMQTVDLSPFTVATTVPSVRRGDVENVPIGLPPLPEQRRIVAKLDRHTARTKAARAHLARVQSLATRAKQATLTAAFRGDLTTDWRKAHPDVEPVQDLLERTTEPEQSRGGRNATDDIVEGVGGIAVNDPGTSLPEGWSWVRLRRIARQETGHTPSRSHPEWWGGDVSWIGIKDANAHHGQVIHETLQTINDDGLANSSARLLPAMTVCLSRTASVGYVTVMGKPMATSQDFATWSCTDALEPFYLMYALMSEGDDIRRFGEGSTHTTIYFPEIRAFHIKLAPVDEQREIIRRIEAAFARIDRMVEDATRAAHLLNRLDQRLLAKAFRGELVPQDPNDEPAAELLARIQATRAAAPKPKRGRRQRA